MTVIAVFSFVSCSDGADEGALESAGLSADASAIAEARGLTPNDVAAALKTHPFRRP